MPIPEVEINIQDPGTGVIPASAGKTQVKLGVSNKGTPYTLYSAGSMGKLKDLLGSGPLLESAAHVLGKAGGSVLFVPLEPVTFGDFITSSTFVREGSGSATVVGSRGPEQIVRVKIGTGGSLATATFQVALGAGSGGYGPIVTTGADPYTYRVPGQLFTKLAFATGTYVANDVYTVNLDGTVTRVGTGTATLLNGTTHSPVDAYDVWVKITTEGALGAAAFAFSLDGGNSYSASLTVPSGGKYVIPNSGVVLTFSGTFVEGDIYKAATSAPGYTTTELALGFATLDANPSQWGISHVVGRAATAAAAATLAAAVQSVMDDFESGFRYARAIVEGSWDEDDVTMNDAAYQTSFASFVGDRVAVVVGDVGLTSSISRRSEKRSLAWPFAAALSATKLCTHPGETVTKNGAGPLKGVTSLYRDERETPILDEARFVTARTWIGKPGYYITRGRLMAAPGSDFEQIMNGRVMDRICTVTRAMLIDFENQNVRIDPDTGFILEEDAQEIEGICRAKLIAALLAEGEVSDIDFVVSRDDDLLSSAVINVEVSAIPKGYTERIRATVGFKNPALAAAA